jgi:hypothetical protein
MPYVDKTTRAKILDRMILPSDGKGLVHPTPHDVRVPTLMGPGDLNFAITALCHQYVLDRTASYKTMNEVVGVLECAKLEMYRTVVAPYEDGKRESSGAISFLDGGKTL